MKKLLRDIPKIDIHCHLDGSMGIQVTRELLEELLEKYEERELEEKLQVTEDCSSLAEYLKRFELPIRCLQTRRGLERAAFDLAGSAAEENVKYLEVRFAPSFSTAEGLSIREILESVEKGLQKARMQRDIETGIIVCGMRHLTMEANLKMLKEAREMFGAGVVACDLAGDEKAYPNADFTEFFALAKKLGMPYTIHSGECGSSQNIADAISMGAKRIGHGIAMAGNRQLMELCARMHIGVEMCPTSNFQTKAVRSWQEYPLREFLANNVCISVNTDNRTVSRTDSTRELEKVTEQFSLTEEELHLIYQTSVEMAFAEDNCKDRLLRKWS